MSADDAADSDASAGSPGPLRAVGATIVAIAAVVFWWIAVSGRLDVPATLAVAMIGGRAATAILGAGPRRKLAAGLGLRLPDARAWPGALLLAGAILPILRLQELLVARLLGPEAPHPYFIPPEGLVGPGAPHPLAGWLVAGLLAPACTELLFRGHVQPMLTGRWGARAGVAAAAVLSGLAHAALAGYGSAAALPTLLTGVLVGLALGALREITGSTTACIAAHALMSLLWLATLPDMPLAAAAGGLVAALAGAWRLRSLRSAPGSTP